MSYRRVAGRCSWAAGCAIGFTLSACGGSNPPPQPQPYGPPGYAAPNGQPGYGGQPGPYANPYPGAPYPAPNQGGYPPPQPGYPQQPGYPPQTGYPPPQGTYAPPPAQPPVARPAPVPTYTPQPAPAPAPPPATSSLPPPTIGSFDVSGSIPSDYMRREPASIVAEITTNLAASDRAKVQGVPVQIVDDPKDVNAFATCDHAGGAFVAVTAPLLLIMARTSEARAFDETFGSSKSNDLANGFAQQVRAQSAITGPAAGFLPLPQALDPRKLARQNQLFDEQLAFVLGHELAHHYRGHTGCTNGAAQSNTITAQDIGRALSSTVPLFNQPNEIQADVEGTWSLLDRGSHRPGAKWTEEGALMTLDFFSRLQTLGVDTILLGFLMTHPAPQIRVPIVQNAAQQWRQNGGKAPAFPFRF